MFTSESLHSELKHDGVRTVVIECYCFLINIIVDARRSVPPKKPMLFYRFQQKCWDSYKLVKMCGPQHVDKNGIHNILTDARVLVFGIYVSILLLPCLWAGCLGLDVEKMMPTNEDLHSPLFYGSASLQPPPHQQKEGGNVTPHF